MADWDGKLVAAKSGGGSALQQARGAQPYTAAVSSSATKNGPNGNLFLAAKTSFSALILCLVFLDFFVL
jgi:hypothetical protein